VAKRRANIEELVQDAVVAPAPGEVVLHRDLTVVEAADAADLSGILADPRVSKHVIARIGSTAAVVLPGAAPRLVSALRKAGHTPTVHEGRW